MDDNFSYASLMQEMPSLAVSATTSVQSTDSREHMSDFQSESNKPAGDEEPETLPIAALLESRTFTVVVGANGRELTVHEAALSRSPVLQCFCRGGFLEATTGRIELKDDDPEIFGMLLSYLYRADYEPYMIRADLAKKISACAETVLPQNTTSLDEKYAMDSAMVYVMADKYQLHGLKKVAVSKLKCLQSIPAEVFFELSSQIYAAVPESDEIFQTFFREYAPVQVKAATEEELESFCYEGGRMALDMLFALRSLVNRPDFLAAIDMTDVVRRLVTASTLARQIYRHLGTRRSESTKFGRATRYMGTSPASIAEATNQSLQKVHAAAGELDKLGLLIRADTDDELWDSKPIA